MTLKLLLIGFIGLVVWIVAGALLSVLLMPIVKKKFDKDYPLL